MSGTLKSKVLTAMACDRRVADQDFRLAFRIMLEDGASLSVNEFSAAVGKSRRSVFRALARLRAVGWVIVERGSRGEPSTYDFKMPGEQA